MPVSFGGETAWAESLKNVPIYAAVSTDDTVIDTQLMRDTVAAIQSQGGTKIKFKEYPTGGHGAHQMFYAEKETWDWLFQQSKALR